MLDELNDFDFGDYDVDDALLGEMGRPELPEMDREGIARLMEDARLHGRPSPQPVAPAAATTVLGAGSTVVSERLGGIPEEADSPPAAASASSPVGGGLGARNKLQMGFKRTKSLLSTVKTIEETVKCRVCEETFNMQHIEVPSPVSTCVGVGVGVGGLLRRAMPSPTGRPTWFTAPP